MNSLEPGSHMLAKKTAYLFDKTFNQQIPPSKDINRFSISFCFVLFCFQNEACKKVREIKNKTKPENQTVRNIIKQLFPLKQNHAEWDGFYYHSTKLALEVSTVIETRLEFHTEVGKSL